MKLSRLAKDHFLGYRLLRQHGRGAIYGLSPLGSIKKDLDVKDVEHLIKSNYVFSNNNYNSFNCLIKTNNKIDLPENSQIVLSLLLFNKSINTEYLFEITDDARISDVLALINNKVKDIKDLEDPYFFSICSEEHKLIKHIKEFTNRIPNFGQEFLNQYGSDRQAIIENNTDNQAKFLNFVRHPYVVQDRITDQYYVIDKEVLNQFVFIDGNSFTDFIVKDDYIYFNVFSRNIGYSRNPGFKVLDDMIKATASSVAVVGSNSIGKAEYILEVNYTCKANNSAQLLCNILNIFSSQVKSANYYCLIPLTIKPFMLAYTTSDFVLTKNIEDKFTKSGQKLSHLTTKLLKEKTKNLNLIIDSSNVNLQKIGDKYKIHRELIPKICGKNDVYTDSVNNYLAYFPAKKALAIENIKHIINNHTMSTGYRINCNGTLWKQDLPEVLKNTSVYFPGAVAIIAVCFYHGVFSNKELVNIIQEKTKNVVSYQKYRYQITDINDKMTNLGGNIPKIAKYIQKYQFKNVVLKSSKKEKVRENIKNVNFSLTYLDANDLERFDSNDFNFLDYKNIKDNNFDLFTRCFIETFFGENGVCNILGITEEELIKPSQFIIKLIYSTFNVVSLLLENSIYHKFDSIDSTNSANTKDIEAKFATLKLNGVRYSSISNLSKSILSATTIEQVKCDYNEYIQAFVYSLGNLDRMPNIGFLSERHPIDNAGYRVVTICKDLHKEIVDMSRLNMYNSLHILNTQSRADIPDYIIKATIGNGMQLVLDEAVEVRLK